MSDEEVDLYECAGDLALRKTFLDDVAQSEADFSAMKEDIHKQTSAQQRQKADAIATGFLSTKQKQADAEAKVLAMERRHRDFQKQLEGDRKSKAKEREQRHERSREAISKAAEERQAWESEAEAKLSEKLHESALRRRQQVGRVNDDARLKHEAVQRKREEALLRSYQEEQRIVDSIEQKMVAVEDRLEQRRAVEIEHLTERSEEQQRKFQEMQQKVCRQMDSWAESALSQHIQYQKNESAARSNKKALMESRSKSCAEFRHRVREAHRENHSRMMEREAEAQEKVATKHQAADERRVSIAQLGLKSGTDVVTSQLKKAVYNRMQQQRRAENLRAQEAKDKALLVSIMSLRRKREARQKSLQETAKFRQQLAKEGLAMQDGAEAAFVKMQCESDERKVAEAMASLGFKMPTLKVEEVEDATEKPKRAF